MPRSQPHGATGYDQRFYNRQSQSGKQKPQPTNYVFPNTLEGFGYAFNEKGELVHIESGQRFEYYASDKNEYNQKRYKAIGELVTKHVYMLLENETHLTRTWIPKDVDKKTGSFFFMSADALENRDKLLILIHGSGAVKAGQWSRRLIINENLHCGSQLPFITRAVQEGYGVIVLNTNLNINGKQEPVKFRILFGKSTPERHAVYVWEQFVMKAKAAHIAIIAHSYGGVVTTNLMTTKKSDFMKRVFAIAFTDSVHSTPIQPSYKQFYQEKARNWVCSKMPLDTPVKGRWLDDAPLVSAGTMEHERTSCSSMESVFTFLREKYSKAIKPKPTTGKKSMGRSTCV